MYKVCRFSAGLLCLIWVAAASADDAVAGPACSANVCVVNMLAYSTVSGATMIQCSAPSNALDNRAFIYDRLSPKGKTFEFQGGKFIRPDAWDKVESEGIPDRFAPAPLCPAKKKRDTPVAGTLIIVAKHPSDSEDHPYCYSVNYVAASENVLTLRSDDGQDLAPLSEKSSEEWDGLKRKLAPYIAAGNPSKQLKQEVTASVKSQKASLYSAPDTATASRMYLLQGDKVEVIDDSKLKDGWCFVRYVTKTGRTIEKWAQAQDLELLHK